MTTGQDDRRIDESTGRISRTGPRPGGAPPRPHGPPAPRPSAPWLSGPVAPGAGPRPGPAPQDPARRTPSSAIGEKRDGEASWHPSDDGSRVIPQIRSALARPHGKRAVLALVGALQAFLLLSTVAYWATPMATRTSPVLAAAPVTWVGVVHDVGAAGVNLRATPQTAAGTSRDTAARGSRLQLLCGRSGDLVAAAGSSTSLWLKTTDNLYVSSLYVRVPDRSSIVSCGEVPQDSPLIPLESAMTPSPGAAAAGGEAAGAGGSATGSSACAPTCAASPRPGVAAGGVAAGGVAAGGVAAGGAAAAAGGARSAGSTNVGSGSVPRPTLSPSIPRPEPSSPEVVDSQESQYDTGGPGDVVPAG